MRKSEWLVGVKIPIIVLKRRRRRPRATEGMLVSPNDCTDKHCNLNVIKILHYDYREL